MDDTASLLRALLAFVWAPLLVAAGGLDWALHRRLRIERTAGLRESALHLLMIAEVGSALLAALLFAPTAGLLALVLVLLALHELSYLADLHVALARRDIPLPEQWVHGFQHLLPWAGLGGLMALSPDQTSALLGLAGHVPDWSIRFASELPPRGYLAALLGGALALNVLPFLEETWRGLKARRPQA